MNMTRWLDVEVGADDTDLNTLSSNLAIVDIHNDNEFKLIVGDIGRQNDGPKLKVFKGAMQISDLVLSDLPLSVVGFYANDTTPRSPPLIAVAYSSCIYVYRNMKVFYKYHLPSIDLSAREMGIWKQLIDPLNQNPENITKLTDSLKAIPDNVISIQSRNFLIMSPDQQLEYLEQMEELPVKTVPEVTCITTLKLNSVDRYSVSCLVVGTEDGDVFILDPQTFSQLSQAKLCPLKRTPYQMVATGLYSVDFRLTVATREKSVCLLKRGWNEGQVLFNTDEHIIAIEVMTADHSIVVICCDNTLSCYSKKGKKQWSVSLEHRPIALTLVPILHLGVTLTAVALVSGHLYFYDGKVRRDILFVRDVVSVMKFGRLGQEEHVLVIVTMSGNLMLKILKRTADFNADAIGLNAADETTMGQKPWLIPKKSKLFIEQSVRERENATAMHESFQLELNRVRLMAATNLLEAHRRSDNTVGAGHLEPVTLSAEVEGLGPVFRVALIVENTSPDKAVVGLAILFHVLPTAYKVSNPYIKVPLLSPGSKLKFSTKLEELFEDDLNPEVFFRPVTGQTDEASLVKILLIKEGRQRPVLAATVQMPATDPLRLPLDKLKTISDFGVTNEAF